MEVDDLELAAEFCKIVGATNLVAYLGLDAGAAAGAEVEAQAKLKARRKFMQGMQSNPKYKREALFLIRHFTNLNDVLGDLGAYQADARRRAESEHLPVIEMTIRGVLRSGSGPTEDQYSYLRRNALELGVTEASFREMLGRVAGELGVPVPGRMVGRSPDSVDGERMVDEVRASETPDLYKLLGIAPTANDDDVRIAYHKKLEELDDVDPGAQEQLRRKYEIARKILSNEAARRHYDVNASRTGPPARAREVRPTEQVTGSPTATTAPMRAAEPGKRPPRLEILGDPVRGIRLGPTSTRQIVIRNGGDGELVGSAASEVPWLTVEPTKLDPGAPQQTLTVRLDPKTLPPGTRSGSVVLTTERGERASVVFEIETGPPLVVLVAVAIGLLALGIFGAIVLAMLL